MRLSLFAAVATLAVALGQAPAQDAGAGRIVFAMKCAVCHSLVPGKKSVGPSLIGVVGTKAGTNDPTYAYSDEMKNSGKSWDAATLDSFLTNPRGYIPGIKMLFKGLSQPSDRANLIGFLATLKQ